MTLPMVLLLAVPLVLLLLAVPLALLLAAPAADPREGARPCSALRRDRSSRYRLPSWPLVYICTVEKVNKTLTSLNKYQICKVSAVRLFGEAESRP
jgi:hypothetical protein